MYLYILYMLKENKDIYLSIYNRKLSVARELQSALTDWGVNIN